MRVLIIEDEPLAAKKIESLLSEVLPSAEVVAKLESVDESIQWLDSNSQPDLILSDIHLSDGICFNIYTHVEVSCPIIFTTAYEKYAIQAFEVNSVDYLLKPIQKDRLQLAIEKVKNLQNTESLNKASLFEEFKKLLSVNNKEYKSRFLCKIGNKIKSVPTENIRYFYSQDKMTFFVDGKGSRYPINNTLDELDQLVDPKDFFRVNRKYIINYTALDEISPYFKGRLKLKLTPKVEDDIVVSTERSPIFKSWLDR